MVKKMSLIASLFFASFCFCQTNDKDGTLQKNIVRFYYIVGIEHSENGRLIGARKLYSNNNDTIMVFDTKKSNTLIGTLIKSNALHFIDEEVILSFGSGNAEYWNIKNNIKKGYDHVRKGDLLKSAKLYFILKNDGTLSANDGSGKEMWQISGVRDFLLNEREKKLFVQYENGDLYKISDVGKKQTEKLYSTNSEINSLSLSRSGKQLILIEKDHISFKKEIVFINTGTNRIIKPKGITAEDSETFFIDEINNGEAYFIVGSRKIDKPKLVEMWYGNDGNLIDTQFGYSLVKRHWIWKSGDENVNALPSEKYSSIFAANSRYFICFNRDKLQNYISNFPDISIGIYDVKNDSFHNVGIARQSVFNISQDGSYLIYENMDRQWILYHIGSQKETSIESSGLSNPKFNFDNTSVFFESDNGLWSYDINNKTFQSLDVGKGKITEILKNNKSVPSEFQSYIDRNMPLFVKITDKENNRSSYVTLQEKHQREVIAPSTNKISEMTYDPRMERFWIIEENYNIPPRILYVDSRSKKKKIIYESNLHDTGAHAIKQEAVTYNSSDGTPLKGLLYYPENYNSSKKYPMVVHIYQKQSSKLNNYTIPGNTSIGFDLRTMIRRGYFVYMPDIIIGASGPGLSAVDCVHNALDAVSGIKGIDTKKIALLGQSFGGYETNFIATHSDRFATYISGAAHSDIVRAYFSYNYNFHLPYYFQFETGIYNMKPFAQSKDLYEKNNPINYVEKVNAPILLWAGKNDRNVPWDHSIEFYTGLKRNNKQVITLLYTNGGHDLRPNTEEAKDLYVRVLEWLDYFLKDKNDVSWINKQMKKNEVLSDDPVENF